MSDVVLHDRRSEESPRCPFCHDRVRVDETTAADCSACGAPLHPSCAVEAGSCASCDHPFQLDAIPVSERACTFHHECGAQAVAGDAMCHAHRSGVLRERSSAGGAHATARELRDFARDLDWVAWILGGLGPLLGVVALAVGVKGLGLAWPIAIVLGLVVYSVADRPSGYLRRRARALRRLLDASATAAGPEEPGEPAPSSPEKPSRERRQRSRSAL